MFQDDYSYSNIVSKIQSDEQEARKAILFLIHKIRVAQSDIEVAQEKLRFAESELQIFNNAVEKVFQHMKLPDEITLINHHRIIIMMKNGKFQKRELSLREKL